MEFTRYAIFYTPAPGPLADFGARWLGWDATTGQMPLPSDIPNLPMAWQEITETPRKYGFHGTFKPPFRLKEGETEEQLRYALAKFCALQCVVTLDRMELAQLGRFLALVPTGDTTRLSAFAADIVRAFDKFRAPLTDEELSRRRKHLLSPRQDKLLQTWGYPYVMDEFRFHLTLSGKLPKAKTTRLRSILEPMLAPLLPDPLVVDALCLMGEGPDGKMRQIERFTLSG